ncbi:MAG: hypothetical protein OXH15_19425 [Gammaproteobacteria bacterium]|nr:hypothetical protein [Gammaproteobacteria bacterium]
MLQLRPFQRQFIREATDPYVDTAALSIPRGNGKSALAGHLVARVLTPTDRLFVAGTESVLCAASIEQARIVFRFARSWLEPTGEYRFLDSATRCAITHPDTGTRLRVIGSNGKTAMGLVNCPYAICDEPGAWEVNGGQLLWDAIDTAKGKPGSPLKAVLIGTLAPAFDGWWHEIIRDGSHGSQYVQALCGDRDRWDQWPEIRRCNPLSNIDAKFRAKLLEERDTARRDSRLRARFMSYRLNVPSADESTMLLDVDDWQRTRRRAEALPAGKPAVGIDLGGGRAWSAAVAMWPSGRLEAVAVAPGVPDLEAQEKRDRVPAGTYRKLQATGRLMVAEGLRVPPVAMLTSAIADMWGDPSVVVCDRFRIHELLDSKPRCRVKSRQTRWSEAGFDIRALRKWAKDGPLSCRGESVGLITASLSAALVKPDDSGNVRLIKRDGSNNTARDDVAAALVLAAGEAERRRARAPTGRQAVVYEL